MMIMSNLKQPVIKPIIDYLKDSSIADSNNQCRMSQLVCEIADKVLHDRYPNDTHWVWSFEQQLEVYSEDSQVRFDRLYKEIMDCIRQEVMNSVKS